MSDSSSGSSDSLNSNADSPLDPTTANYDAQQLAAEIQAGEEKAPKVDAEADYERSKQFDVAEIDRATASADSTGSTEQAGNPESYLDMAKQVTPKSDH